MWARARAVPFWHVQEAYAHLQVQELATRNANYGRCLRVSNIERWDKGYECWDTNTGVWDLVFMCKLGSRDSRTEGSVSLSSRPLQVMSSRRDPRKVSKRVMCVGASPRVPWGSAGTHGDRRERVVRPGWTGGGPVEGPEGCLERGGGGCGAASRAAH